MKTYKKKVITLEQSQEHVAKMSKWLALTPMQRLVILQEVNAKRGENYKTLSAGLGACLKYV